ncbi:unnamed protein product, partial [marine sediment metagenome]
GYHYDRYHPIMGDLSLFLKDINVYTVLAND